MDGDDALGGTTPYDSMRCVEFVNGRCYVKARRLPSKDASDAERTGDLHPNRAQFEHMALFGNTAGDLAGEGRVHVAGEFCRGCIGTLERLAL